MIPRNNRVAQQNDLENMSFDEDAYDRVIRSCDEPEMDCSSEMVAVSSKICRTPSSRRKQVNSPIVVISPGVIERYERRNRELSELSDATATVDAVPLLQETSVLCTVDQSPSIKPPPDKKHKKRALELLKNKISLLEEEPALTHFTLVSTTQILSKCIDISSRPISANSSAFTSFEAMLNQACEGGEAFPPPPNNIAAVAVVQTPTPALTSCSVTRPEVVTPIDMHGSSCSSSIPCSSRSSSSSTSAASLPANQPQPHSDEAKTPPGISMLKARMKRLQSMSPTLCRPTQSGAPNERCVEAKESSTPSIGILKAPQIKHVVVKSGIFELPLPKKTRSPERIHNRVTVSKTGANMSTRKSQLVDVASQLASISALEESISDDMPGLVTALAERFEKMD